MTWPCYTQTPWSDRATLRRHDLAVLHSYTITWPCYTMIIELCFWHMTPHLLSRENRIKTSPESKPKAYHSKCHLPEYIFPVMLHGDLINYLNYTSYDVDVHFNMRSTLCLHCGIQTRLFMGWNFASLETGKRMFLEHLCATVSKVYLPSSSVLERLSAESNLTCSMAFERVGLRGRNTIRYIRFFQFLKVSSMTLRSLSEIVPKVEMPLSVCRLNVRSLSNKANIRGWLWCF